MNVSAIAQICHEANKAICETQGDNSQKSWAEAEQWQKDSAIQGVAFKLNNPGATPEDQHKSWCDAKYADGWKFGSVKNPETKEHPCLVPYSELPEEQQAKDHLFAGIVTALMGFLPTVPSA